MTGAIDSRTMTGAQREVVLRALAKCKHHRRLGYRATLVAAISVHKDWPDEPYDDNQADAVDLLRFVYRHQLTWPVGIYEPPPSRRTGREMGLCGQLTLDNGMVVGAQDQYGNPVWHRWDGRIPSPPSEDCCR